jgi:hypothetical protein
VYLAFTPAGRPVAVKVLRPELGDDPQFQARFRQEIAAARRVHGLFTAELLDADPDGSPPWLATAYVPGPSLAQMVTDHGPLPARTALLLIAGVAEALAVIHSAGLVHRDLKPSNVLLAGDGPRVIDFGIARAVDATAVTRAGMVVGSPAYMAPEQISGGDVTAATDVFALGALAAFAVTGRAPFGDGGNEVLYRVVHADPDLGGCPGEVRALAQRCLAKDPAARPTSAQIIDYCRSQAGTLEFTGSWLPPAIAAELASRAVPGPAVVAPPGAGPWDMPHPGTGPTERRTLLQRDQRRPPRPRRGPSRPVLALAAAAAVIVALAAYGLVNLAGSGGGHDSPTADLDSCLFGTWTGAGMTYPYSTSGLHATFTGTGPTMIFRSDGVYVIQYGLAAALTAHVDGITYSVRYAGSTVSRYTARNGTLLPTDVSARGSYTVYDNAAVDSSASLPSAAKGGRVRYTCSADTLHLSFTGGASETLIRSASP